MAPIPEGCARLVVLFAMFICVTSCLAAAEYQITFPPPGALPNASTGREYAPIQFTHDNGGCSAVTQYVVTSGALPSGMTLSTSGLLSGIPELGGEGNYAFTVTLEKAPGGFGCFPNPTPDSENYTLEVVTGYIPLAITTTELPASQEDVPYEVTIGVSDGDVPFIFSASGLPAGLSIDEESGEISGTAEPDTYLNSPYTVTVMAQDSYPSTDTEVFELVVLQSPVGIRVTALPTAIEGQDYGAQMHAERGTEPFTWTASGLPAGLSIDAETGAIGGTVAPGAANGLLYDVTVTVTDAALAAKSLELAMNVSRNLGGALRIFTSALAYGYDSSSYTHQLLAIGGEQPYTWQVEGLPGGLSVSASGLIKGVFEPSASETSPYWLTVTLVDAGELTEAVAQTIPLNVLEEDGEAAPLVVSTTNLADAQEGALYAPVALEAMGGVAPYRWSVSGLPNGLSALSMEGNWVIAGSPAMGSAGTWVPTLTVSDALGASAQGFVEIDVHDIESSYVTIVNNSLPSARESEPYGPVTIVASGGTQPYFVEAEGLPYGIELVEGESGEWLLTGVAGAASAGVYAVTVTLSDSSVPPLSDEDVLMLSVQSSAETSDAGAPESPVFPSVSLLTPPAACALHSGAGLSVGLGFFASLASCAFRRRKRLP